MRKVLQFHNRTLCLQMRLFNLIESCLFLGADPKSVLCSFFKFGQCTKGTKCKFSHDLTIERKAEKRSLYVDMRDDDDQETMESWSEEKLKEVVDKKHGESNKTMPTTEIVSSYRMCYCFDLL